MKSQPQYLRIRRTILDRIRSGALPAGSRLPAREALMAEFGVTRVTVDRALSSLLDDGVLKSRRRGGTTVEGAPPPPRAAIVSRYLPDGRPHQQSNENFYALFHAFFEYGYAVNWEIIPPDRLRLRRKEHEKYDAVIAVRPHLGVVESWHLPPEKLILINRTASHCRCVSTDHRTAARRMTGALLRRFPTGRVYFLEPDEPAFVVDERRLGFIDACEAAGRFYRIAPTANPPPPKPDAPLIFFSSHSGGLAGILPGYEAAGMRFGREIFGCEFDYFAAEPSIPTAIQDYAAMGRTAVDMLLRGDGYGAPRLILPDFRNFGQFDMTV